MIVRLLRAFGMAMGLYTALPGFAGWDDDSNGWLAAMLPLVGFALGGLWVGIAALTGLFMPPLLRAVAIALTLPLLTGFLHLDGFMDVSDALLSRRPREDKLRILKDPHTGAFAVISVGCLLLAQAAAMAAVLDKARPDPLLLLLPVASRAMAAIALMACEPLSQSSYGRMNHDAASKGKLCFCGVLLVAALAGSAVMQWRAGLSLLAAVLAFILMARTAIRALGGMNGDVAGCSICVAELCGLVFYACL